MLKKLSKHTLVSTIFLYCAFALFLAIFVLSIIVSTTDTGEINFCKDALLCLVCFLLFSYSSKKDSHCKPYKRIIFFCFLLLTLYFLMCFISFLFKTNGTYLTPLLNCIILQPLFACFTFLAVIIFSTLKKEFLWLYVLTITLGFLFSLYSIVVDSFILGQFESLYGIESLKHFSEIYNEYYLFYLCRSICALLFDIMLLFFFVSFTFIFKPAKHKQNEIYNNEIKQQLEDLKNKYDKDRLEILKNI